MAAMDQVLQKTRHSKGHPKLISRLDLERKQGITPSGGDQRIDVHIA